MSYNYNGQGYYRFDGDEHRASHQGQQDSYQMYEPSEDDRNDENHRYTAAAGTDEQYNGFVNHYPEMGEYRQPGDMSQYQVPNIQVDASSPIANTFDPAYPGQTPYVQADFNDNQYYGRNSYQNEQAPSINSVTDYYANQDTRPILEQPHQLYNYQQQDDIENPIYVDQNGDDYQINTYLNSKGDMVDPFEAGQRGEPSEWDINDYGSNYDDEDGSSSFGSYGNDVATLDRLGELKYESDEDGADLGERKSPAIQRKPTVVRKFKLCQGNFIFDCPISSQLLSQYSAGAGPEKLSNEFKFMRYQAVTCEPNQFQSNTFNLRQLMYPYPRRTELMIVITMYNEDDILLGKTLKGVMDNIRHFTKRSNSSVWGPDAWKKICVCVVSDGRSKINERSLALMSALGCYQDGFAKEAINDKKVVTHVYEHTTKVNITSVSSTNVELGYGDSTIPVQMLFCLKEKNQKKINSHRWAFEAFAETLNPNVIILLDAGTMPGKDSIYQLWREFKDPQVGGACGEIKADLGSGYTKLLNPLIASQNFEYKMSNILDKTTESNFGFISVLPGAFSAYRFEALKGEPMRKYFLGDDLNGTVFISNMYLAEDRILCFEIVTKRDSNWVLRYCRGSYGATDVPEKIPEFILQRRRWLNGSFFAALYSFIHFYKIFTSGHTILRKIILMFEFTYLFVTTLVSWFSLSSFFLVFRILTLSIAISFPDYKVFRVFSVLFLWLYGLSVLVTFILSLGNKPKGTPLFYLSTFIFFAVLMVYMLACSIYMSVYSIQNLIDSGTTTFKGLITKETFRDLVISIGSTYALYLLSSIIYLHPMHMFTSLVQYVLLSPSYINVLNIYAFCNVHDISWGTKGSAAKPLGSIQSKDDGTVKMEIPISEKEIDENFHKFNSILTEPKPKEVEAELSLEESKSSYYAMVRSLVVILWVVSNFIIVAVVLETGGISQYKDIDDTAKGFTSTDQNVSILNSKSTIYFSVILWIVAFMALFRFIGCCVYCIGRTVRKLRF
ncbi:Chs1 [Kluyveromyces lactis]|nr:Chs1 [Kluyveromyces lactis]